MWKFYYVKKNLQEFNELLIEYGYSQIEIQLIQASYIDDIGLLRGGNNPIFIIKGVKSND